jgi:hypothetical protein
MPIGRAPREDMIVRASTIDAAVIEATSGVALDCSKTFIAPEASETIAGDSAVQAASGVTERTKTIYTVTLDCSQISIVLKSGETIVAIEGFRRKPALTD